MALYVSCSGEYQEIIESDYIGAISHHRFCNSNTTKHTGLLQFRLIIFKSLLNFASIFFKCNQHTNSYFFQPD